MFKKIIILIIILTGGAFSQNKIFIYMDLQQTDHLRAYGITFNALKKGLKADWLLNYRGGSFLIDYSEQVANECRVDGVAFDLISSSQAAEIYSTVQREDNNMDVIRLEKAPKIAVYVPVSYTHLRAHETD